MAYCTINLSGLLIIITIRSFVSANFFPHPSSAVSYKKRVLQINGSMYGIFLQQTISSGPPILTGKKPVSRISEQILPLFNETRIVLTQGFIGSTDANESTTLGREGSDYSAAIFANLLEADSLTIWKDVEGVMNADPKAFPDARYIRELGYDEVIEMAFYGAQVIHPKTIKPLQNKNIPLYVKCFLDPDSARYADSFKTYSRSAAHYCFKTKSGLDSPEIQGLFICRRRRNAAYITYFPHFIFRPICCKQALLFYRYVRIIFRIKLKNSHSKHHRSLMYR